MVKEPVGTKLLIITPASRHDFSQFHLPYSQRISPLHQTLYYPSIFYLVFEVALSKRFPNLNSVISFILPY